MKIGFVNQPFDTLLPPYQNSVGACTYGVATSLKECDFVAYGELNRNQGGDPESAHEKFRFLPSSSIDRLLFRARTNLAQFIQLSSPISTSGLLFPQWGKRVAQDLAKQRCDVVHVQHASQYVPVIRAYNPTAKIVLHLHAEWFSQSNPAMLNRRIRHIDLLTTVSNYITEKTRRQFPSIADRCETAYNGIALAEFSREKDYQNSARRLQKRIVYAGAISPHKGLHVLTDAMDIVARQYQNVQLDIVGPPSSYPVEENFDMKNRELLQTLAPFYPRKGLTYLKSKLPGRGLKVDAYQSFLFSKLTDVTATRVNFLGMVPRHELINHYYDADVFVFPSIWDEGFGLPPVEAMAAGVPVVASKSGAVTETVVHGNTGFLVEKNAPQALAEAILKLLRSDGLREQMGRAGRRRALCHFTWEAAAASMRDRYRRLCG
jgi:glycosyltransferase involved in cell wall biosynthesis